MADKAELTEVGDGALRSVQLEFPVRGVVKLHRFIKVPRRAIQDHPSGRAGP